MKKNTNILFIILSAMLFLFACTNEDTLLYEDLCINKHKNDIVINIKTYRTSGNILSKDSIYFKKKKQMRISSTDPFTIVREVECFESIILPELQPHIWLGNVLTRNSVANCNYKPIACIKKPITISTTLSQSNVETIENPSFSATMKYIKEQISNSSFIQNDEFDFSVEQFTSYNELKSTFGCNVNTDFLFWGGSTSETQTEHHISKATGLYIKFFQTSFKAIMDYPTLPYTNLPKDIIDSAVYVNSITYGRLGIMALETNMSADYAKSTISSSFHKLFTSGSSNLTKEEKDFLDGCDFKVYLIGGEGASAVQTFTGLSGFVDHIKKGNFSKEKPGVPIFCTFNNVSDNSQASIKFIYSIKKQPLYIELLLTDKKGDSMYTLGTITAKFYSSLSRVPAIAKPQMPILVEHSYYYRHDGKNIFQRDTIDKKSIIKFYNSGQNTSQIILQNATLIKIVPTRFINNPRNPEFEYGYREQSSYRLLPSEDYIPINTDKIDYTTNITK